MNSLRSYFDRLSVGDRAAFAQRLSFLIGADVPIVDALGIIRRQSRTQTRKNIFDRIIDDVSNGSFLSASLERFRDLFGGFTVDIIRVGEESGTLSQSLGYLADELQKRQALRRKIMGAMVYPACITLATIAITGMITVYIFPKIIPIFRTMHVALPLSTKILVALSNLLINHGILLGCGGLAAVVVGYACYRKNTRAQKYFDRIVLRVPIFGSLLKSYHIANFCRTMGMLLKTHFGIVGAIRISAETMSNLAYREIIEHIAQDVQGGMTMTSRLESRQDMFPLMVSEMIGIGEKTGNLDATFLYLAGYYENAVDDITKNLSGSLEPVLMIAMGIVVGFVAISVITPIYAITQNIHR